ncbi:MAG: helix-turn-helix transcriptional regulator [Clostridia bacterium]
MDERIVRQTVADNLIYYRRRANMTQLELADKLNYSDKSISKWERAEGIPDLYTLTLLAEIFDIQIADLINYAPKRKEPIPKLNKRIITMIIAGFVWLISVIIFVTIKITMPTLDKIWLVFIYAVPISMIVMIIFSLLWGKKWLTTIFISIFIWGTLSSVFLTFPYENMWLIFIIGLPLQIMTILWFNLKKPIKISNILEHIHVKKGSKSSNNVIDDKKNKS